MFNKKLLSTAVAMVASFGAIQVYAADAAKQDAVEEIVVSGIRESLAKAVDIKKKSEQIVDSIVAEDIGKLPDNNVVEAMQHIAGVQVGPKNSGEGSQVLIRGSGAVVTTINGREAFTSTGRSMALQDIPATMVAGIDVYKTSSANLVEGGIGGSIDVRTHRAFDFEGSKVSLSAKETFNEQSGSTDPNVSLLASNRWDTSAGEFGALLNVAYSVNNYRDESIWGGGFFPYNNDGSGQKAWTPGVQLSTTDMSYSLMRDASGAWDRYGVTRRPDVNLSFQWKPTDNLSTYMDVQYQGYHNKGNMSFLFTRTDSPVKPGTSYEYYPGTNIVHRVQTVNAFLLTSTQANESNTEGYQFAVGADWAATDKLDLKSELSYQTTTYARTGQILDLFSIAPSMNVDFKKSGQVSIDYNGYSLNNSDGVKLGSYFDNWQNNHGDAISYNLDGKYKLEFGAIDRFDFGIRVGSHNAQNDDVQNVICNCWATSVTDPRLNGILDYTPGNFYKGDGSYPGQWLTPSTNWLLNPENQKIMRAVTGIKGVDGKTYTSRPDFDPTRHFDITEDTTAAYVQTHYGFDLGGKDVDGLVGVRVVNTKSTLIGYEVKDGVNSLQTINSDDTVALPSASARIKWTDDLITRLTANKTLTRPAFGDLNPATTLRAPIAGQIQLGSGSGGNAHLQPIESVNYDASLEWYFAKDSALTATLFSRNLSNTIVSATTLETIDGIPYQLGRPLNQGESQYQGIEVSFQYFPDNLPALLQGFGLQSSYTYIDGHTKSSKTGKQEDLVSVSKDSYSVALAYEKEKFSSRLSYVYRSSYIDGYNSCCSMPQSIIVQGFGQLDLSASYAVSDSITLTLDGTNLLGDLYHDYFGSNDYFNRDSRRYARTFSAGVRASF